MKKFTLFFIVFGFCVVAYAQHTFPAIAGPTNVAQGSPVTLSINDTANAAAVPASSTGTYNSFSITVDWSAGGGGPWSSEADLTVTTTAGSITIDPATSGQANSGTDTTLTFSGDLADLYDPTTDGFLEITLNQSYSGSDADWSNISVTINESPSCPPPSGMATANLTTTSTDLNWTAGNAETMWNVEWKAGADFTAGNSEEDASANVNTSPTTSLSGLTPNTTYYVYYQADCGGGDTSDWVGPFTFYTGYCESDPSSNDGQGISQIVLGTQTFTSGGDLTYEDFTSPTVDLAAANLANLQITFATGYTYDTNVWIDFNNDLVYDNTTELVFDGVSAAANPTTLDASFTMPNVALGVYNMRIGTADGGQATPNPCYNGSWGVTIDMTVNITTPPDCIAPNSMAAANVTDTAADLSWTAGDSETMWNLEWNAGSNFTPGNGEEDGSASVSTTPAHALSALNSSTTYYVYYQADCGTGTSDWVGPFTFTTDNTPPPPPNGVTCNSGSSSYVFTEDFETNPPAGWTGTGFSGSNGNWDIAAGNANSGGTGPETSFSGGMHLEYEASGNSTDIASAISPAIDLSTAVDGAELSFYMHAFGADMGTLNVGVGTSATGPFTNVYTWIGDYQAADDENWVPIGINLDAYLGQIIYIEFSYGGAGTGWEGDMSIDLVRVETCGTFCIAPSGITVSNITGTTADISWTANSGESAWEYVVQPAGTGEPTAAGTNVTTPSVTVNNLDYSTDYEVYVRAICASGESVWAGPIPFTTPIQTNFTLDCATDGPLTLDYCYDNGGANNPLIFTFSSTDGTPLNLVFNSGNVENNWDELVVMDSDGNPFAGYAAADQNYGNGGDLSGISFQSTGDTISFYINSDGSVSCGSGSSAYAAGINYTVSCATCINHAATYTIVDDCDNGDQFLIDVNVTSMGDATDLTISNNIDANTTAVTATGTYQIGPFPFMQDVIVTISNDNDVNCVINSQAIQLLACPPENDNPCNAIVAVVNDSDLCTQVTPGTLVEATPSGVPDDSCAGDADDDVWFQFTALNEEQFITIANIQGGTTNLDHAVYEGTCDGLTELYCSSVTASVATNLTVGNTYYVRVFSWSSNPQTSTFDLCVKQAPANTICENAENFCSVGEALVGSNIVGLPDPTDVACLGSVPNPSWNIIQIGDPGLIEIEIRQWADDNNNGVQDPGENGLDVDFAIWGPFTSVAQACDEIELVDCPTCPFSNNPDTGFYPFGNIVDCSYSAAPVENLSIDNAQAGEIYMLLVTNFNGGAGVISIEQTNVGGSIDGTITAEIEAEITSPDAVLVDTGEDVSGYDIYETSACEATSVTLEVDSPFADSFVWYEDGFVMAGETGPSITVTQSNNYQVQAIDDNCGVDTYSQIVVVNLYESPVATIDTSPFYYDTDTNEFLLCPQAESGVTLTLIPQNFSVDEASIQWQLNGVDIAGQTGMSITVHEAGTYSAAITNNTTTCSGVVENIMVVALENCEIPQGISPGVSPGQNDTFDLRYFDVQSLEIFNRNGTRVYSKTDYTNEWIGQTDDGQELPVGTYFYTMVYENGTKKRSGWIYINR